MVTPLIKRNVVHKRTKAFLRHHSDRYKRISYAKWRKPRGIDSQVRRRWKGTTLMPMIGYGTKAAHRHILPSGFLKFRVHNVKEIEMLLLHNRKYACEIARGASTRTRKAIIERAAQLNVKVKCANAPLFFYALKYAHTVIRHQAMLWRGGDVVSTCGATSF
jgi:large subunit ribosomal protein L32e